MTDPTTPAAPVYVPVTTRTRGRTPHGLHLILTICTVGFWSPMWIAHALWNHATVKRTTTRALVSGAPAGTPRERAPWTRERVIRTAVPALILFVLIVIIVAVV